MTNVWFTSDLHFGHRLCSEHRGFGDDTLAHDAAIVENWRRVVNKRDTVWVLGDLSMASPTVALAIIRELPGTKHLIAGNHDSCHPMHRNAHRVQKVYLTAFESVQPFARRQVDGIDVLLSHFPYNKDRHEVRYTQWRLRDEGRWLLHGHTHGKERREGREIHVGVDAWDMTPVPIHTVRDLMRDAA